MSINKGYLGQFDYFCSCGLRCIKYRALRQAIWTLCAFATDACQLPRHTAIVIPKTTRRFDTPNILGPKLA